MKIFCLLLALLFFGICPVQAVAPVNANTIAAALDYGKDKSAIGMADFFQPWTVYEEKAVKLDESGERAVIFTPFLLIAADARDRTLGGGPVTMDGVEKVLNDYNGYFIFGLTLYGPEPGFAGKLAVSLRQGKKTVNAHLVNVPVVAEKAAWARAGQSIYEAPCYVYFLSKDIAADKPATLILTAGDKRQRSFYFPLNAFR